MPEINEYEHGTPSWVDIGSPDVAATVSFYSELLGWTSQDLGEEAGHYTMALKDGKLVAAIGQAMDPGPPRWTTYVSVDDIEAVSKNIEAAGGEIIVPSQTVMTAGKMAIFKDATGAFIAAWEPADHKGAQLVNEPGAFTWSELTTSDLSKSREFYSAAFGWTWGGDDNYAQAEVSGRPIGGVLPRPSDLPAEVPDFWLVYFAVPEVNAGTVKATSLGASMLKEPTDIPGTGRFSVLADPLGATFALFSS
jgi:predicted enzyme related to lactoylglutathione lyase